MGYSCKIVTFLREKFRFLTYKKLPKHAGTGLNSFIISFCIKTFEEAYKEGLIGRLLP